MSEAKVEAKPAAKAEWGWIFALVIAAILFILIIPVALYVGGARCLLDDRDNGRHLLPLPSVRQDHKVLGGVVR